jgi:SAM-dependent methyltransferase
MDANQAVYRSPDVVDYFSAKRELDGCEIHAFSAYIPEGARILDLGVGGGRTTEFLSARSSSYLGIDYSPEMVKACSARFPGLRFEVMDARDLGSLADAMFDAVVFSFNGLDYLPSPEDRVRALKEIHRVLKPGGVFIFSVHHARGFIVLPRLPASSLARSAWRVVYSIGKTFVVSRRTLFTRAFRKGDGYILDPTHGGLKTRVATPRSVQSELDATGFATVTVINGLYPRQVHPVATPWYYYVATREPASTNRSALSGVRSKPGR